jgi:hypothetical protein
LVPDHAVKVSHQSKTLTGVQGLASDDGAVE